MWLLNRPGIFIKLLIAPVLALVLMLVLAIVSYFGLSAQQSALKNIYEVRIQLLKQSSELHATINSAQADAYKFLNWSLNSYEASELDKLGQSVQERVASANKQLTELSKSQITNEDEKKIINSALENSNRYEKALKEMIEISKVQASMATTFMSTAAKNYDQLNAQLTDLRTLERDLSEASYKQALSDATSTIVADITFVVIAVFVSLTVTFLIVRIILKSITSIQDAAKQMSRGDLTCRAAIKSTDEIAEVAHAFNALVNIMQTAVKLVREQAQRISKASHHLVTAADTVSNGSKQQSEAAATIAATIEESAVSIASISDSADHVRAMAKQSLDKSSAGDSGLKRLLSEIANVRGAFEAINTTVGDFVQSTTAITEMTRQVKGIADQTNLLALNATIEAARAGEQGRGFAVVANEVRGLAEKSAMAVSHIDSVTQNLGDQASAVNRTLLQGTSALESSVELLTQLEQVFSVAHNAVTEATGGIDEISTAMAEQKQGTEDIARNIDQIAQMSEENNHVITETSSVIKELDAMANNLEKAVASFKTE